MRCVSSFMHSPTILAISSAPWRRRSRRYRTTLREKLIKIGAKVVRHGRYVAFQMAEVAIPRNLFADILRMYAAAHGNRPQEGYLPLRRQTALACLRSEPAFQSPGASHVDAAFPEKP